MMLNWLFVLILKLPLGLWSSSCCKRELERRKFIINQTGVGEHP